MLIASTAGRLDDGFERLKLRFPHQPGQPGRGIGRAVEMIEHDEALQQRTLDEKVAEARRQRLSSARCPHSTRRRQPSGGGSAANFASPPSLDRSVLGRERIWSRLLERHLRLAVSFPRARSAAPSARTHPTFDGSPRAPRTCGTATIRGRSQTCWDRSLMMLSGALIVQTARPLARPGRHPIRRKS